jgi:hypothetical protein
MKRVVLLLAAGVLALGVARAGAQTPADPAPRESRSKAFKPDQTLGAPPTYALKDVTILLAREAPETGTLRKVTYSGAGKTVYVQVKGDRTVGEKADACTLDDVRAVLQEIYRAGFFQMAADYTRTLSVEVDSAGEVATYLTEPRGAYPKVTLTVRIGGYAKTVTAVDTGGEVQRYETPRGLLDLADFILSRPEVAAVTKEVEK